MQEADSLDPRCGRPLRSCCTEHSFCMSMLRLYMLEDTVGVQLRYISLIHLLFLLLDMSTLDLRLGRGSERRWVKGEVGQRHNVSKTW